MPSDNPTAPVSKKMLWAGRIMSALPVLGLLFSASMKLIHPPSLDEGFTHLGWPVNLALALGILELACTIVYVIPRTAMLGAILLTGYLGGAIATHVRIGEPFLPVILMGVLIWGGLFLRDPRLRALIPLCASRNSSPPDKANTMDKPDSTEFQSANEIVSARTFKAPRELVWKAWTDPKHLARWWGPNGFTNTFQEFDLRPGGNWRFAMHSPKGTNYQNHSVFVEVVSPQRIVFDHVSEPRFQVTATFGAEDGQTQVIFRMRFASVEEFDQLKPLCVLSNEQNFDRLEVELARMR